MGEQGSRGTVLVIGGAGYIGSHTCKALAHAGFTPVTYDNMSTGNSWAVRWGPLERGDILDVSRLHEVFQKWKPVGVLHFAALALVGESTQHPSLYYRTNVGGTVNLLDACRIHRAPPVVFSSTCAIYGAPNQVPISEDTDPNPVNPYGASKLMAERVLHDYQQAYGLQHAALRYFNAAGADPEGELGEARDVETHLIPLALDAVLNRRPPLQIFGGDYATRDGTAVRDYIHVSDLAEAHVRALDHLLGGRPSFKCNLGTGSGYSVQEVLTAIKAISGNAVPHTLGPRRAGDPPDLVAEPTAAREILGQDFTPRSSLTQIIQTAWAWHTHGREAAEKRSLSHHPT